MRPVYQYDLLTGNFIKEFPNVSAAADIINQGSNNITLACTGERYRKSAGGFRWSFEKLKKLPDIELGHGPKNRRKTIAQYDLEGNHLKTFDHLLAAAQAVNRSESSLSLAANGTRKSSAGFQWRFTDQTTDIDPI